MLLMRANPLQGQVGEGWVLEIEKLLSKIENTKQKYIYEPLSSENPGPWVTYQYVQQFVNLKKVSATVFLKQTYEILVLKSQKRFFTAVSTLLYL